MPLSVQGHRHDIEGSRANTPAMAKVDVLWRCKGSSNSRNGRSSAGEPASPLNAAAELARVLAESSSNS
eukprot:6347257-Amphidinium_carterae.1